MTIENITRTRATSLTGVRHLPSGMRWYLATGVQFFPRFGDWKLVFAGDDGLTVIVGKCRTMPRPPAASGQVTVRGEREAVA